jgi:hypothetical protein
MGRCEPFIGITDAKLSRLAREAGVPRDRRAQLAEEWKPHIKLYRAEILRIEREGPVRDAADMWRVVDTGRELYKALVALRHEARLELDQVIRAVTEGAHAADAVFLNMRMLAQLARNRELARNRKAAKVGRKEAAAIRREAAALLKDPPPIDPLSVLPRVDTWCSAATQLAEQYDSRKSRAATRRRKTRARNHLVTGLAVALMNHLPPIAHDQRDGRGAESA